MKTIRFAGALLCLLLTGAAVAQTTVAGVTQKLKDGCQKELDSYCKAVTPGEGRVLACLYAYSDMVSVRCEHALYDVGSELEYVIAKLSYVADACAGDLQKYCATMKPGEGRIANCLKQNQSRVSPVCRQAVDDTGITAK